MLPIHSIETVIQFCSPDQKDIILELRNLISAAAPDAVETVHDNRLVYCHAGHGGPVSAGICQIGIHHEQILLAFIHGAFLDDPLGLLEGTSKYKKFVSISSFSAAPWDAITDLIRASTRFDPYSLKNL